MSPTSQLQIDHLANDYVGHGSAAQATRMQRQLDRMAREGLLTALVEQAHVLGDHGIYRIGRIDLDVVLQPGAMNESTMVRIWAQALISAIVGEMGSETQGNVRRYDSYGDLMADLAAHLVIGDAWQCWQFAEFGALSALAVDDALVEVLPSRPEYLPLIARTLHERGLLATLFRRLSRGGVERLCAALRQRLTDAATAGQRLAALTAVSTPLATPTAGPAERAITLFLELLRVAPASPVTSWRVATDVALIELLRTSTDGYRTLSSWARSTPPRRLVCPADLAARFEGLAELVVLAASSTEGHAYVSALARIAEAGPTGEDSPKPACALPDQIVAQEPVNVEFATRHAGLAFVLIHIADLGWHRALDSARLCEVMRHLVDPDSREALAREELLVRWFPDRDQHGTVDWPMLDEDTLHLHASIDAQPAAPRATATLLAVKLAQYFAQRLPGLELSSTAYLAKQFFQHPGHVAIDDEQVVVRMPAPPLAVVLKMAGMTGWQGRLPWLGDRALIVELT